MDEKLKATLFDVLMQQQFDLVWVDDVDAVDLDEKSRTVFIQRDGLAIAVPKDEVWVSAPEDRN